MFMTELEVFVFSISKELRFKYVAYNEFYYFQNDSVCIIVKHVELF